MVRPADGHDYKKLGEIFQDEGNRPRRSPRSRSSLPLYEQVAAPVASGSAAGFSFDAAGAARRGRPRNAAQTDLSVGQAQVNAFFGVEGSSVPSTSTRNLSLEIQDTDIVS